MDELVLSHPRPVDEHEDHATLKVVVVPDFVGKAFPGARKSLNLVGGPVDDIYPAPVRFPSLTETDRKTLSGIVDAAKILLLVLVHGCHGIKIPPSPEFEQKLSLRRRIRKNLVLLLL